jgi:hypothetical protein
MRKEINLDINPCMQQQNEQHVLNSHSEVNNVCAYTYPLSLLVSDTWIMMTERYCQIYV